MSFFYFFNQEIKYDNDTMIRLNATQKVHPVNIQKIGEIDRPLTNIAISEEQN